MVYTILASMRAASLSMNRHPYSIRSMRKNWGKIRKLVSKGQSVTLTHYRQEIAEIVPLGSKSERNDEGTPAGKKHPRAESSRPGARTDRDVFIGDVSLELLAKILSEKHRASLDMKLVRRFRLAFRTGEFVPDVLICRTTEDGPSPLGILDGRHRVAAAIEIGHKIPITFVTFDRLESAKAHFRIFHPGVRDEMPVIFS